MNAKSFLRRTQYLMYYLKKLDWPRFRKFLKYTSERKSWSNIRIVADAISCVYHYNIGFIDYFIFSFFDKDPEERSKWAGTGYKYEYDLKMNPKETRHLLADKIEFYAAYKPFVIHSNCTISDLQENNSKAQQVLSNPSGKIVVKDSLGQCGWNVEILESGAFDNRSLVKYMKQKHYNLAEEYIIQHPDMKRLSDSGVNTIRIITQLNARNDVDILGARLRISVNNFVDNLASGNIAAAVDVTNGRVIGPGVYSDITKTKETKHPVSGISLVGYQLPLWKECIDLVTKAALHRPENRSVGWDVVITEKGPELLEGNHNWCKILWQLPVNTGLKKVLENYLLELESTKSQILEIK
jgi:hypothetical protein